MRLIFAGTPEFSVAVLDAVVAAGYEVALVLCQPDRPAGRGQRLLEPPVKQRALALGLPGMQPQRLRGEGVMQALAQTGAEVMLVVAYGLILPAAVLALPPRGCINVHASLLPRWRGAAPIQRAIEAGDRETGITIMQMDAGLDTGPMLLGETLEIEPADTGGTLHDKLARLGARLAVRALAALEAGQLLGRAQPAEGVTYARKIERADSVIDWRLEASELANRIRAFDPAPGCLVTLDRDEPLSLKLWRAQARPATPPGAVPGSVLGIEQGCLRVACGRGELLLIELQRAGGRRQPCEQLLRGLPINPGERFVVAGA